MNLFGKKKIAQREFVPVVMPHPNGMDAMDDSGAPRKKILVIDDDPVIVKTLSLTLNAQGYRVLSAADGSEAIGVIQKEDPDMMLVDVGLKPDLGGARLCDGFQVAQWLQRANARKIPSIIISGSNKPAYPGKASAVGAGAFLTKPLNNDVLLEAIERALAQPALPVEGVATLKMAQGSYVE